MNIVRSVKEGGYPRDAVVHKVPLNILVALGGRTSRGQDLTRLVEPDGVEGVSRDEVAVCVTSKSPSSTAQATCFHLAVGPTNRYGDCASHAIDRVPAKVMPGVILVRHDYQRHGYSWSRVRMVRKCA